MIRYTSLLMKRKRKSHSENNFKNFLKKVKKLLTSTERCAKINKLSPERVATKTQNLDNKTVYSNPENSYNEFLEQNLNIGKNGKNKPRCLFYRINEEGIFLKTSFQEASIFLRKISIREFDPGSG